MEEKKGTGKVVAIVILIILLLGVLGCLGYGYTKYDALDKKCKDMSNELIDKEKAVNEAEAAQKEAENAESNYLTYMFEDENYKVYALGYMGSVIGYDGELYLISVPGASSYTFFNCSREVTEGAKFTDGKYSCRGNQFKDADDMDSFAYKLNIKESDINKVVITHHPAASDATYLILFIYKDGKVSVGKVQGSAPKVKENIVPNKEVKDVTKVYCTTGNKLTCKGISLDVVLKDGTKETIKDVEIE